MNNVNAAHNLRTIPELMKEHNLSLRGLARLMGVSPSLLSRICNRKRKFLVRHKENIAQIFGIDERSIQWPDK